MLSVDFIYQFIARFCGSQIPQYLQETIENREGYYQRQEKIESVPTRGKREGRDGSYQRQERGFRPKTRDRVAKLKKCKSWGKK